MTGNENSNIWKIKESLKQKEQEKVKEKILPFEHKPFGLMRIIAICAIIYLIFLRK